MCWYYLCDYYEVCNEEVKTRSCHTAEPALEWSRLSSVAPSFTAPIKSLKINYIPQEVESPLRDAVVRHAKMIRFVSKSHYCNNKVRKTVIHIFWIKPNLWLFGTTWCFFLSSQKCFRLTVGSVCASLPLVCALSSDAVGFIERCVWTYRWRPLYKNSFHTCLILRTTSWLTSRRLLVYLIFFCSEHKRLYFEECW